ncbi:MAG: hypothetical protein HQ477_04800 [Chloroflexi bacterium]|nr:hypothetical protein [Chloroflexota bacterium]
MSYHSTEESKLSNLYDVDARHEGDLERQFEQITEFETAAALGDWELFKAIVNKNESLFLKLMRRADGDPRLFLPLFKSGELEQRFSKSLHSLGKTWEHLMPWWARLGYRYEVVLIWISVGLAAGAIGAATSGTPMVGGVLGAFALVILVVVDNSEPRLRGNRRWWVRLISPKSKSILNRWRTAIYVVAILMVIWSMLAGAFKTPQEYCEGLSPADLVAFNGCVEAN